MQILNSQIGYTKNSIIDQNRCKHRMASIRKNGCKHG